MAENPKKLPQINENLLDQLRGLFFAKDRSLLIAKNQMLGMGTQNTPTANPPSPYLFIYPKADGKFYRLDSTGNEQLIGADTFLGLIDTPDTYTANYHLKVNSAGTALELVTGQRELIREYEFLGSDTSFTFSDIPQIYRHLFFSGLLRVDRATELDFTAVQFNGDTGNNYHYSGDYNVAAVPTSSATINQPYIVVAGVEAANSAANAFSGVYGYILDYANASIYKSTNFHSSVFGNASATGDLRTMNYSGQWDGSTNAITSIKFLPTTGPNFVAGCKFQLYGIL